MFHNQIGTIDRMSDNELSISPEQLLRAIHQHVSGYFFDAKKAEAKQCFQQLSKGGQLPLLHISSQQHGDVAGVLALDSSEFIGRLNFSAFRDALASHLNNIAETLRNDDSLNMFTAEDTGAMLFNLPGFIEIDDTVNVMVCGVEQSKPGEIVIKLMFLDPANYLKQ